MLKGMLKPEKVELKGHWAVIISFIKEPPDPGLSNDYTIYKV